MLNKIKNINTKKIIPIVIIILLIGIATPIFTNPTVEETIEDTTQIEIPEETDSNVETDTTRTETKEEEEVEELEKVGEQQLQNLIRETEEEETINEEEVTIIKNYGIGGTTEINEEENTLEIHPNKDLGFTVDEDEENLIEDGEVVDKVEIEFEFDISKIEIQEIDEDVLSQVREGAMKSFDELTTELEKVMTQGMEMGEKYLKMIPDDFEDVEIDEIEEELNNLQNMVMDELKDIDEENILYIINILTEEEIKDIQKIGNEVMDESDYDLIKYEDEDDDVEYVEGIEFTFDDTADVDNQVFDENIYVNAKVELNISMEVIENLENQNMEELLQEELETAEIKEITIEYEDGESEVIIKSEGDEVIIKGDNVDKIVWDVSMVLIGREDIEYEDVQTIIEGAADEFNKFQKFIIDLMEEEEEDDDPE